LIVYFPNLNFYPILIIYEIFTNNTVRIYMLPKPYIAEQIFLKNSKTLLKNFKKNSVLNKDFPIILKKYFKRILFDLFGVIPLSIRKSLLSLQDGVTERLFRREAIKFRRLRRKRLVKKLRKVPSYMYYTTFLQRMKRLPLVMPKESFCYKKSIVTNFIFRLYYRHKIGLDKKAFKDLVDTTGTTLKTIRKKIKDGEKNNEKKLALYSFNNNLMVGYFRVGNERLLKHRLDKNAEIHLNFFLRNLIWQKLGEVGVNLTKSLKKKTLVVLGLVNF